MNVSFKWLRNDRFYLLLIFAKSAIIFCCYNMLRHNSIIFPLAFRLIKFIDKIPWKIYRPLGKLTVEDFWDDHVISDKNTFDGNRSFMRSRKKMWEPDKISNIMLHHRGRLFRRLFILTIWHSSLLREVILQYLAQSIIHYPLTFSYLSHKQPVFRYKSPVVYLKIAALSLPRHSHIVCREGVRVPADGWSMEHGRGLSSDQQCLVRRLLGVDIGGSLTGSNAPCCG